MKTQGVRGRDEESYLLTLSCQMSDKKKPMRKEEVAKNKEITSTLLKHRHTSVPRTTCTVSSVCNRTIGVSSALRIKLELYVAQHEKKRKFMNMCLHIAYAFSTESDAVYLFSEQVFLLFSRSSAMYTISVRALRISTSMSFCESICSW